MTSSAERFWARVDKSGDCWIWTGTAAGAGYGHFYVGGGRKNRIRTYAHRWSYEQTKGPIPAGLEIDHRCRVRRCVNPDHLEPATHAENQRRTAGNKHGPYDVGASCRQGHERTTENTGINGAGYRFCRPCRRATSARYKARTKTTS